MSLILRREVVRFIQEANYAIASPLCFVELTMTRRREDLTLISEAATKISKIVDNFQASVIVLAVS